MPGNRRTLSIMASFPLGRPNMIGWLVLVFMSGLLLGDIIGARRWQRRTDEALQLAAQSLVLVRSRSGPTDNPK